MDKINYPREQQANIDYRIMMRAECDKDPQMMRDVLERCKEDIIFWIDGFVMTYDPRKDPRVLPFIIFDEFQEDYILDIKDAIENQYDALTEKSRDMGVSWMVLIVFLWFWIFHLNMDFLVISEKEEKIDKLGDMKTLFEKIRFILRYLPSWMKPQGYIEKTHAPYMRLINPQNQSVITGETSGADAGRGGRCNAVLIDESASCSYMDAIWGTLGSTTPCRLPVSTPKGSGNKFAELAKGTGEQIKVISLHWTLHPEKAKDAYYYDGDSKVYCKDCKEAYELWLTGIKIYSPWYDKECSRNKAQDIAQEQDIDYLGSGSPYYDMQALATQRKWEYIKRRSPGSKIPYGNYIKVDLVEVGNNVEIREREDGWLRIFELPNINNQYSLGGDTSEGLPKGDESFGVVRDKTTTNVVAACNGLWKPEDFGYKLWLIQKYYKDVDVIPENNNHGYTVCLTLDDLGCKLYYTKKINPKTGKLEATQKRGFTTNRETRRPMLDIGEAQLSKGSTEIRCPVILKQMETFVRNERRGEPEADGNFKDDGVIAWSLSGYGIAEIPFKKVDKDKYSHLRSRVEDLRKKRKNGGFGMRSAG